MNLCLKWYIFIYAHIVIHFITNRPHVCRMDMVIVREVKKVKFKLYSTIFQMPWFWTIWHKLKITEFDYQYGTQKLC